MGYGDVALPHKFKIAVGGCPNNCVKPDLNDFGVIGQRIFTPNEEKCRGCKKCVIQMNCPMKAPSLVDGKISIDPEICNNCGRCHGKCPFGAFEEATEGYKVCIGGRWGKKTAMGKPLSKIFTSEDEVMDVLEKTLILFRDEGIKGERFADTVNRLGFDYVENKILCLVMAFVITVSAFSGCTVKNDGTASTDDSVTFTDALERTVTVKKNPRRVAALLGSFADTWVLAGGRLCAAAEEAWEDFDLDLTDAANLGGAHSPNLEILLSSDPDFVIASSSTAADVEMKETLENAGITVAYFDVDNFYDYLSMLDICTDITGRKDLYEENGLKVKEEIERIKSEFAEKNLSEEKRTVLLLRTSANLLKAKGSEGTVLGEMLKDLGCINIADSDKTLLENLSVESIIREEPYRIFAVSMGDDAAAQNNLTKTMEENPAWGGLSAIENNRLHVMDRTLFNLKPNAEWALAYERLVEILLEE